jgi:hypothetical protein
VRYASEGEARAALFSMWETLEPLESIAEVKEAIQQWKDTAGR